MMTKLMPRLGDTDFRNGESIPLAAEAETWASASHRFERRVRSGHKRCENVAGHGLSNIAVSSFPIIFGNGW